ncbi:MAG: hypothetical protein WA728_32655, partial [Xanthobacteraceae bacterium]
HGMDMPMAVTLQDKGDRLDGVVAGLYASLDLMGIATHGGERTHSHWVSLDMTKTAHLDRWGLKARGTFCCRNSTCELCTTSADRRQRGQVSERVAKVI